MGDSTDSQFPSSFNSSKPSAEKIAEDARIAGIEANQGNLYAGDGQTASIGGGVNRYGEERPDFLTQRDVDGNLGSQFTSTMGDSYSALRDKANAQGDTQWASLQRQGLQDSYGHQMGDLQQQNATGQAQARSSMAMRGGLGGGSRERLASQGALNTMMGQQGLGRDLASNNLNLSIQDEEMKNSALSTLGGVEQGIQSANIGRLGDDISNQNAFQGGMYSEDMKAFAAEKSADAQAAAADSGGKFLGIF